MSSLTAFSLLHVKDFHMIRSLLFALHVKDFHMIRSLLFVLHVKDFHKLRQLKDLHRVRSLKDFLNMIFLLTTWQIIKDENKTIIWFQTSAVLIKIKVVLQNLLNFDCRCYYVDQARSEQKKITVLFNENLNQAQVLLFTFDSERNQKIDLQKRCRFMHFFEFFMNNDIEEQCICRIKRIENSWNVIYIFKYYVFDTIASQSVIRNIEKCFFETSTNFNREIVDDEKKIEHDEIEKWIKQNDHLWFVIFVEMTSLNLQSLSSTEFVRYILKFQIEKIINVVWNESEKNFHRMIKLTFFNSIFIWFRRNLSLWLKWTEKVQFANV